MAENIGKLLYHDDEITTDRELRIYLKQLYPKYDTHVIAIDELNKITPKMKQIIIINYKKRKDKGTHWVAIVVKEKRYAIYFDSYGLDPPNTVLSFMRKYKEQDIVSDIVMNIRKIQPNKGKGSKACGYFILKFLKIYIDEEKELYEAIGDITIKNTLAYAKKLRKKYFFWLANVE